MPSLGEIISLLDGLVKLGLTPPVQSALTSFFARWLGVDDHVLDAAIQAAKDPPPPKGV